MQAAIVSSIIKDMQALAIAEGILASALPHAPVDTHLAVTTVASVWCAPGPIHDVISIQLHVNGDALQQWHAAAEDAALRSQRVAAP